MKINIYQKLIEVRKTVPYLQKGEVGTQYQYTGSSRVLAAVVDKMNELGLLLVPSVTGHTINESAIEFKDSSGNITKRTTTYFTELEMTMTWINAEKPDEQIVSSWYGQGVDIAGEKGVGKALTYAEKYFMLKFFNIATDKDDPDVFQTKHDLQPESIKPSPQSLAKTEQTKSTNPSSAPQNATTGQTAPSSDCISDPQYKLLNIKWKNSVHKDLPKADICELLSAEINKIINDFKEIKKADINKVIKWFENHAA